MLGLSGMIQSHSLGLLVAIVRQVVVALRAWSRGGSARWIVKLEKNMVVR